MDICMLSFKYHGVGMVVNIQPLGRIVCGKTLFPAEIITLFCRNYEDYASRR